MGAQLKFERKDVWDMKWADVCLFYFIVLIGLLLLIKISFMLHDTVYTRH